MTQRTSEPVPTNRLSLPLQLSGRTSNHSSELRFQINKCVHFTQPLIFDKTRRLAIPDAEIAPRRSIHSEMNTQQGGPYGRT